MEKMENEMKKMIENKEGRMKEMKESKGVKCLIWNEKENKLEISDFPLDGGKLYVTGSSGFLFSKSFILDMNEIMKKHTTKDLLESGLLSIFIENNDELVFREDKYIHVKTEQLQVGDIVIKYSIRKIKAEEDIISTPASYWLAVGEAFVYKGNKPSAPAHSAPAPRPERRGDRHVSPIRGDKK